MSGADQRLKVELGDVEEMVAIGPDPDMGGEVGAWGRQARRRNVTSTGTVTALHFAQALW
jgi:hypothetical protein